MPDLFDIHDMYSTRIPDADPRVFYTRRGRICVRSKQRWSRIVFHAGDPDPRHVKVLPFWDNAFATKDLYDGVLEVFIQFRVLPPVAGDSRKRFDVRTIIAIADPAEIYTNDKRPLY